MGPPSTRALASKPLLPLPSSLQAAKHSETFHLKPGPNKFHRPNCEFLGPGFAPPKGTSRLHRYGHLISRLSLRLSLWGRKAQQSSCNPATQTQNPGRQRQLAHCSEEDLPRKVLEDTGIRVLAVCYKGDAGLQEHK